MTDSLVVLVNNIAVGTLSRMRENRLAFEYDDEYRNRRDATPLSVFAAAPDSVAFQSSHYAMAVESASRQRCRYFPLASPLSSLGQVAILASSNAYWTRLRGGRAFCQT